MKKITNIEIGQLSIDEINKMNGTLFCAYTNGCEG